MLPMGVVGVVEASEEASLMEAFVVGSAEFFLETSPTSVESASVEASNAFMEVQHLRNVF